MATNNMHNKIKVTVANAHILDTSPFKNIKYCSNPMNIPTSSDNGVFVGASENRRYYFSLTSATDAIISGQNTNSRAVTGRSFGGVPCYLGREGSIRVGVVGPIVSEGNGRRVRPSLVVNTKTGGNSYPGYESEQWTYNASPVLTIAAAHFSVQEGISNGCEYENLQISIQKVEISDTFDSSRKEANTYVYATGFNVIIKSSNQPKEELQLAFVSMLSPDKDAITVPAVDVPLVNAPMIMMDANGLIHGQTYGGNIATNLSPAMSDDVIKASNTGVIAVSCLVATKTHPCWPGYKNSLYRIYDGPKPLIGKVGEKISIGKHDFVYLLHSSYAFRIS